MLIRIEAFHLTRRSTAKAKVIIIMSNCIAFIVIDISIRTPMKAFNDVVTIYSGISTMIINFEVTNFSQTVLQYWMLVMCAQPV